MVLYLFIYLFICLFAYLFIYLFIYLLWFIYLMYLFTFLAPLYPLQDFKALYKYCIIILLLLLFSLKTDSLSAESDLSVSTFWNRNCLDSRPM